MALRRSDRDLGFEPAIQPIPSRSAKPLRDWARVGVAGDSVEVTLSGWRAILAFRRRLSVPLAAVTAARHAPEAYSLVSTTLRVRLRPRSHVYRLGVFRGRDGWSFWACGLGRGAVLIETTGYRFRFVVVEVADPAGVAASIEAALRPREAGAGEEATGDGS